MEKPIAESGVSIACSIENNLHDFVRCFANRPGNVFHEDEALLWYCSGIGAPSMLSNCIYKSDFTKGPASTVIGNINDALTPFRKAGLPLFLTTGPGSRPHDVGTHLEKCGLMHVQKQSGMALEAGEMHTIAENEDLVIKRVVKDRQLHEFLDLYTIGFTLSRSLIKSIAGHYSDAFLDRNSPVRNYLGYIGGKAAGTISVMYGSGAAGMYNIITHPAFRRRKIAATLLKYCIQEAAADGHVRSILQATPMGRLVYEKMGYREYCTFDLYLGLYGSSRISFPLGYIKNSIANRIRSLL